MTAVLHCWAGKLDGLEAGTEAWAEAYHREFEGEGTCMLERGHGGPHEFWPDGDIGVEFL